MNPNDLNEIEELYLYEIRERQNFKNNFPEALINNQLLEKAKTELSDFYIRNFKKYSFSPHIIF